MTTGDEAAAEVREFKRPTDPTPEFDAVRERFDLAWRSLDELAGSRIPPLVHFRLGAIALDVIGSAAALSDAHRQEITRWFDDELFSASDPRRLLPLPPEMDEPDRQSKMEEWRRRISEAMTPEWHRAMEARAERESVRRSHATAAFARFGAAFKAFFYFTRAYQDVIYVGFSNAQGRAIGTGSMANALNDPNRVGQALTENLPNYLGRFREWRDQRNRWKMGNGQHLVGPAPDIGIGFLKFNEQTRGVEANLGEDIVRLRDATRALEQSSDVTRNLVAVAKGA